MNERVYDIALEVLKDQPGLESWTFTRTELAQFGEMIVQDCVAVCEAYGHPDGTSATAQILAQAIKSKFGLLLR